MCILVCTNRFQNIVSVADVNDDGSNVLRYLHIYIYLYIRVPKAPTAKNRETPKVPDV